MGHVGVRAGVGRGDFFIFISIFLFSHSDEVFLSLFQCITRNEGRRRNFNCIRRTEIISMMWQGTFVSDSSVRVFERKSKYLLFKSYMYPNSTRFLRTCRVYLESQIYRTGKVEFIPNLYEITLA